MAEIAYAKQFLTSLDSRPQKLSSDYVADPKTLPAQSAFILPRMQHPYTKPSQRPRPDSASASTPLSSSLSITLSALRQTSTSPAPETIDAQSKTSIYDLKSELAARTGYAIDKIKILWERKPITDSKTVSEVVGVQEGSLSMSVMYVGAPTATPGTNAAKHATAGTGSGPSLNEVTTPPAPAGKVVMDSDDFWSDLRGFLTQRVRDESVADEAVRTWRQQWQAK